MVKKKTRKDHDRLKIDMQFQVHTADDDKMLRCGKSYGGEYTPGASMPEKRRITFKDKKIAETCLRCRPPQWEHPPMAWIVRRANGCLENCIVD